MKSSEPKVTICIPVRNGARTIQRTLDSLLNQDYTNYEIIVSDNCSDDDTAKIVNQYASRGVQYYFNPVLQKGGAERNWNHILTLAKGRFIALYHADDIYAPTIVRRQVQFLLKYPKASAVFTMTQTIDEYDRPIKMGTIRLPKELRGKEIFQHVDFLNYVLKYGTFVIVPTMMSRRDTIDHAGVFNWDKYATASDIDLYLRMSKQGPIGIINEPLHKYRISDQQGSAQLFRQRTFLAHYFNVMDDHISTPEAATVIQQDAVAFYKTRRAADQVRCSLNMLQLDRLMEAKYNLTQAMKYEHVINAAKMAILGRPQILALFLLGGILLISSYFGIASFCGHHIYELFQWRSRYRRTPMKRS